MKRSRPNMRNLVSSACPVFSRSFCASRRFLIRLLSKFAAEPLSRPHAVAQPVSLRKRAPRAYEVLRCCREQLIELVKGLLQDLSRADVRVEVVIQNTLNDGNLLRFEVACQLWHARGIGEIKALRRQQEQGSSSVHEGTPFGTNLILLLIDKNSLWGGLNI